MLLSKVIILLKRKMNPLSPVFPLCPPPLLPCSRLFHYASDSGLANTCQTLAVYTPLCVYSAVLGRGCHQYLNFLD